jgi:hypothetical protein
MRQFPGGLPLFPAMLFFIILYMVFPQIVSFRLDSMGQG